MTAPDPQRAVDLEDQIAAAARKPLANAMDKLLSRATALWVETVGSLDAEATPEQAAEYEKRLRALILALPKGPQPKKVLAGLGDAQQYGAEEGARQAGVAPRHGVDRRQLHPDVIAEVRGIPNRVAAAYANARVLLAANGTARYADVVHVVATARGALTSVDRTARWSANRAIADGVTAIGEEEGIPRVWVPERSACLHCLAYAGHVVEPGALFPAGLTYGDRPLSEDPVPNPPLHPSCQCRAELFRGEAGPGSYPDGLRREADRTVLRGRSEYASEPALVRAADRLLTAGVIAPESVKRHARRAVVRGAFQ